VGAGSDPVHLVSADGVRLAGRHLAPAGGPGGLAFVLCHGFTGSMRRPAVRRIAARLHRYGGVLGCDFRGHGGSAGRSTMGDGEVLDVDAAVGWARRAGYRQVVTVGFSMGGSVVLRHAAGAPTAAGLRPGQPVDAVVSVSAPSRWYIRDTAPMRRVHWLCETPGGRLTAAALLRTRLGGRWPVVPESPIEAVHRIPPTPLLLVHGDRDGYFPAAHAVALATAAGYRPGVAGPVELWLLPGFGHAEGATTPDLVDRIAGWALSRTAEPPAAVPPPAVLPPAAEPPPAAAPQPRTGEPVPGRPGPVRP
jgi:pimeloyl-ACP methyl ester carboxylesterase